MSNCPYYVYIYPMTPLSETISETFNSELRKAVCFNKVFQALTEASAVFICDTNNKITWGNNLFCHLLGRNSMEVVSMDFICCIHSSHKEVFINEIKPQLELGQIWKGELCLDSQSGEIKWVDCKIVPFLENKGSKYHFVSIFSDVTERVVLEQELRTTLHELEQQKFALDQASIVAMTDLAGTILYANDKFCEISKYSREELLGQNHRILNSGTHNKKFFKDLWKTIQNGGIWKGEICNQAKDKTHYWVETTIVPTMGADGRPYRYVAIRSNITDKKSAQQTLQGQRAKALYAEKMASLGEMSAGIAHELGNPLSAIRGRMEMLERTIDKEVPSAEQLKILSARIIAMSDKMSRIIKGLRSYARDGSKDPFSQTSLTELVEDIIAFSDGKFKNLHIDINLILPSKEISIMCREAEIGQVIVNLISNACDAIKELKDKWINIEVTKKDSWALIAVTDSGNGISNPNEIFNPFFTTKAQGMGTGLGLSISKTIVEAHHGSIEVDSNYPNTRFVVRLPLKQNSHE